MQQFLPWSLSRAVRLGGAAAMLVAAAPVLVEAKFRDPLDLPAQVRKVVTARPLLGITLAGEALVAVGSRGMIVRSADGGKSWTQSAVPVQSDLLAVHFPNPERGWAVGHDGVILHSGDGGRSWTKQLDGRIAAVALKKYYATRAFDAAMASAAAQIELNYRGGPTLPWLDVWFEDAQRGFVVGSFGMFAATADGGKTWQPWLHRIDNEEWLNLNSIRGVGGHIYIAGERGNVWKLDREQQRFRKTSTGYLGSFFGIMGSTETLLAFGLRGVVYRSDNAGTTWEALTLPARAPVTAGTVRGDGAGFVLVTGAGELFLADARGRSFRVLHPAKGMRYTGVLLAHPEAAIVTGLAGVRTETLPGDVK